MKFPDPSEFQLELAVPDFDAKVVDPWFFKDGPSHREIVDRAERRRGQGWTTRNTLNPSTKRLAVRVRWVS